MSDLRAVIGGGISVSGGSRNECYVKLLCDSHFEYNPKKNGFPD